MIPLEEMGDEDFERHALAVLQRELGLDGLARFLRLYRSGTGDYTRDRHRWLEGATIQDIMAEVERDKPAASLRPLVSLGHHWRDGDFATTIDRSRRTALTSTVARALPTRGSGSSAARKHTPVGRLPEAELPHFQSAHKVGSRL
jgi:hypothetical protein